MLLPLVPVNRDDLALNKPARELHFADNRNAPSSRRLEFRKRWYSWTHHDAVRPQKELLRVVAQAGIHSDLFQLPSQLGRVVLVISGYQCTDPP